MLELAPNVFYVPGKNKSRFPYCACLYVAGRHTRVLIDAGMGASRLPPVRQKGIDLLLLTHCHIDHRLTRRKITEVPVGCHPMEKPFLCDSSRFHAGVGLLRSGLDLGWLYENDPRIFRIEVTRTVSDGERIDLGGISLEPVLTPGHSPGHLAFFIPEHKLLFTADVDLGPFGPFYGHDFSDIDDFATSIDRLKQIPARTVATGHAGPFTQGLRERFDAYKQVIAQRERALLANLDRPRTAKDLVGRGIIYRRFYDDTPYGALNRWFEQVHIEKHLARLEAMEKIRRNPETGQFAAEKKHSGSTDLL